MQNIENGKVVVLSLIVEDPSTGEVLESHGEESPMLYLHGYDNLIASLEPELAGLGEGETFDVTLEDAYGPALEGEAQAVPKKEFPRNWRLEPGFSFLAGGTKGNQARLWVHEVRGSRVYVAGEHPWGGRTLRFHGTILGMRNATLEERDHGHAHGPGGHVH
jgi:FKBP-type peptidyl-prolyl cis-trans isomerase SlyD